MAEAAVCSAAALDAVDIDFHGVVYTITIQTHGEDVLVVEIEDKDSFDKWRGEFAAKYVEDITSKTGSFKKFAVFVRMLQSAVLQQSDSVYVDLLTYQDLELLKSKKAAAAGAAGASSAAPPARQLPASNKRYLIMTYASEFDRVHYPLPLLHEGQPDPQRLKAVVHQLRQQLEEVTAGQQQQIALLQQQHNSKQQRRAQVPGAASDPDAAVLSSRLEVMAAQLERERAEHKRELRRSARQLQELQEELCRSRDVSRQLRLKLKACEEQLQAARERELRLTAAAAAAGRTAAGGPYSRRSGGGASPYHHDAAGWARGGGSSSYLAGNSSAGTRHYSKYPARGARNTSSSGAGLSRDSSPASSRAQSPGYSRPWAQRPTPPRPPRPSSAPSKQRFDPTEYVRQKQARQQQLATQRGGSSSRGSSPARSRAPSSTGGGSGASSPRGMASPAAPAVGAREPYQARSSSSNPGSRQNSVERGRAAAAVRGSSDCGGYLRPTLSSSSDGSIRAGRGLDAGRAAGSMRRNSSREQLGAAFGVAPVAGAGRSSSRQGGRLHEHSQARPASRDGAGAASPGRALQGVRDKLSAFMAKQQQHEQPPPPPETQAVVQRGGPVIAAGAAVVAAAAAPPPPLPGAAQPAAAASGELGPQGSRVFEDASSEIASIDQRLHALQDFLKKAKSSVAAS